MLQLRNNTLNNDLQIAAMLVRLWHTIEGRQQIETIYHILNRVNYITLRIRTFLTPSNVTPRFDQNPIFYRVSVQSATQAVRVPLKPCDAWSKGPTQLQPSLALWLLFQRRAPSSSRHQPQHPILFTIPRPGTCISPLHCADIQIADSTIAVSTLDPARRRHGFRSSVRQVAVAAAVAARFHPHKRICLENSPTSGCQGPARCHH